MKEKSLERIQTNAVGILVVLVVAGFLMKGAVAAVSILAGGLLALLNHRWMIAGVDAVLGTPTPARRRQALLKTLLRLLLILGTLFAMIHFSFSSLLGGVLGLSILILAGLLEALIQLIEQLKRHH